MDTSPKETPKAFAAFEAYCALGSERSLRKLAAQMQPDPHKVATKLSQLGEWSSLHHWQERVKQWDHERAEEQRRKREADIDRMNARHAQIGVNQQINAIEQIKKLIEAKSFGSQATVQLLKLATDLERVARGVPAEIIEQQHSGSVGHSVVFVLPELVEETAQALQTEIPPAEDDQG